jgi:hypothetical protein
VPHCCDGGTADVRKSPVAPQHYDSCWSNSASGRNELAEMKSSYVLQYICMLLRHFRITLLAGRLLREIRKHRPSNSRSVLRNWTHLHGEDSFCFWTCLFNNVHSWPMLCAGEWDFGFSRRSYVLSDWARGGKPSSIPGKGSDSPVRYCFKASSLPRLYACSLGTRVNKVDGTWNWHLISI